VHDRESILLRHADSAMYAAKAQGKNRVASA
jgi:GGDEF domain-containing protein